MGYAVVAAEGEIPRLRDEIDDMSVLCPVAEMCCCVVFSIIVSFLSVAGA